MADTLIFISCGQLNDNERQLGEAIRLTVDSTPGFQAYFAQAVQDLDALGHHVFNALNQAAGAVVVLHDRVELRAIEGQGNGHRSSVWVNQELALLAYRQYAESRRLPILCFADEQLALEGAMTALIVNPRPLVETREVVAEVSRWLRRETFQNASDDAFRAKWDQLSEVARLMVAALIDEGGQHVSKFALRQTFERGYAPSGQDVHQCLSKATIEFESTDLVKVEPGASAYEYTVHPTWDHSLRRAVRSWMADRKLAV